MFPEFLEFSNVFRYRAPRLREPRPRPLPIGLAKRYCFVRVEPKHGFRRTGSAVAGMDVPWLMVTWNYDKSPAPGG